MHLIVRQQYLDELVELYGTPDIKVITGIRRSGKSVLLQEFISYLESLDDKINIVMINLQELEFDHLLEYHALHKYILDQYKEGMTNVLLIDEVQLCQQFERAINSIYTKRIYDIYITGSNAFLLSSDLATLFTGRTIEIKVFPFSFKEYLAYYEINENYDEAFDQYVRIGGMPGAYVYKNESRQYDYIKDVYSTILIRDLVEKYKIRNKQEFTNISEFMMDNIGNLLSPNNISKALKNNQSEITRKTVSKYIGYLENAFLFYEAKRYDLKGKKYLANNSKYYLCDSSFRYAINGTRNMDFGRVYENIVYLELLRRGYEVYVGKLYKKEVDFVAKKRDTQIYIQVSDNIADNKTFEREYSPLLAIKDAYPKMIIARTYHENYDYQGIQVIDIRRWLQE
ncbi:ATP-binding protein [Sharpea azabuensis]|uniref:ATP-binding protein n=1 Tax=Sharpea porci TaxID=2652286 RepID=A0A844FSD3_9FIRM|nr:ATP-binding protein [Sharpea porci]MST88583.1 ATP-binding protein [Sharpea porci]